MIHRCTMCKSSVLPLMITPVQIPLFAIAVSYSQVTPIYQSTYSFVNDFPALLESVPNPPGADDELFQMRSAKGTCKVMCFHPKSNVTMALMTVREIKEVVKR